MLIFIDWLGCVSDYVWDNVRPEELCLNEDVKMPRFLLPFSTSSQLDEEFSLLILKIISQLTDNAIPLNQLLCAFSSFRYSNNLIQQTHELGADLNCVVDYDYQESYPLFEAYNNSLESLDYLLELGATVPQGLENTIDLVESVKMNYEGVQKKQGLKILKKHGYS